MEQAQQQQKKLKGAQGEGMELEGARGEGMELEGAPSEVKALEGAKSEVKALEGVRHGWKELKPSVAKPSEVKRGTENLNTEYDMKEARAKYWEARKARCDAGEEEEPEEWYPFSDKLKAWAREQLAEHKSRFDKNREDYLRKNAECTGGAQAKERITEEYYRDNTRLSRLYEKCMTIIHDRMLPLSAYEEEPVILRKPEDFVYKKKKHEQAIRTNSERNEIERRFKQNQIYFLRGGVSKVSFVKSFHLMRVVNMKETELMKIQDSKDRKQVWRARKALEEINKELFWRATRYRQAADEETWEPFGQLHQDLANCDDLEVFLLLKDKVPPLGTSPDDMGSRDGHIFPELHDRFKPREEVFPALNYVRQQPESEEEDSDECQDFSMYSDM
jgi:hypothetical protein